MRSRLTMCFACNIITSRLLLLIITSVPLALFNCVFMQSANIMCDRQGKRGVKTGYWLMQEDTCRPPAGIQRLGATWMLHYDAMKIQMQIRLKSHFLTVCSVVTHTWILTAWEEHSQAWLRRYCFSTNPHHTTRLQITFTVVREVGSRHIFLSLKVPRVSENLSYVTER
jgi:hypothetical protein